MVAHNGTKQSEAVFPPQSWEQLDDWLFRRSSELLDTPCFRFAVAGEESENAEKAQRLIKELDAAHAAEVRRCLEALVECGEISWNGYSDECRYLIKVRLTAASSFVSTVGLATGSPILFPPDATKFVEWLLADWWREQGVIEIAYNLVGEI